MRAYLIKASSWAMVLIFGVPFGAGMGVSIKISGETTTFTLVASVILALLFGTAMTFATNKQRHEHRLALETIPQSDWRAAQRAAWSGPVPGSPEIRAVAAQLAGRQLDRLRRHQKFIVLVFGLNLALAVVNTIIGASRWYILLALGWTVALIGQWYSPRRLRRRIELLSDKPTSSNPMP
jgi:hypothetical protein